MKSNIRAVLTDSVLPYAMKMSFGIMSMDERTLKEQDMELMKNEINGLNEVYREIANEIGIENARIIHKMFHGTQISFPGRLYSKEYTHRAIIREYNGKNILELAKKYDYSERSIWRIIKTSNTK